jgi:hypothetical protein
MSGTAFFFALAAIEVGGLFAIWFLLNAKVRRYLELENLLSGVREEAGGLVRELNETADRNVSLVEDRMVALRELLGEVDRRMGVSRRELETRANEREVYAKLSRRRPIVPEAEPRPPEPPSLAPTVQAAQAFPSTPEAPPIEESSPITLSLGPEAPSRGIPELRVSENPLVPAASRREEALELYRRGLSAELIAAKLGATVAEIELLVEMEERRQANFGGLS